MEPQQRRDVHGCPAVVADRIEVVVERRMAVHNAAERVILQPQQVEQDVQVLPVVRLGGGGVVTAIV